MSDEIQVASACPACRAEGMRMRTITHDVPHFGDCLETLLSCAACGFRHADFLILSQKDPTRHEFSISSAEDLRVRVIRSHSGTLQVPELGFLAEPTTLSESFVSNVEGVLERVRRVLMTARNFFSDEPEKVKLAEQRLQELAEMMEGERPATLILDDPFGNSAILSDRARTRELTAEEIEQLKTGMVIIDKRDLEAALDEG